MTKKKTNNGRQTIAKKIKAFATQTSLKSGLLTPED
jgi:hypothetical protein